MIFRIFYSSKVADEKSKISISRKFRSSENSEFPKVPIFRNGAVSAIFIFTISISFLS